MLWRNYKTKLSVETGETFVRIFNLEWQANNLTRSLQSFWWILIINILSFRIKSFASLITADQDYRGRMELWSRILSISFSARKSTQLAKTMFPSDKSINSSFTSSNLILPSSILKTKKMVNKIRRDNINKGIFTFF